jgi:lactate permease
LELTGLGAEALAGHVALLHACLGWILLFTMVRLADDGPVTRSEIGWTLLAGGCFFVPFLGLAFLAGPELPSLAGALIGTALFVTLLRRRAPKRPSTCGPCPLTSRLISSLSVWCLRRD